MPTTGAMREDPMPKLNKVCSFLGALLVIAGCTSQGNLGKGSEGDAPIDGKLDSFRAPTDEGALTFGAPKELSFGDDRQFLALTFELEGAADVTLETAVGAEANEEVDTVLYLYKRSESGTFGRYIQRNDDITEGTVFSRIEASLEEGVYRVIVKPYETDVTGDISLRAQCSGDGCGSAGPIADGECVFGATYADVHDGATGVEVVSNRLYESPEGIDALLASQIIEATHQSSYTDVRTIEDAFEAVDSSEINVAVLRDRETGEEFRAIEYGAGDNSYGGIFEKNAAKLVASIQDGDLYECIALEGRLRAEITAPVVDTTSGEIDPFEIGDACVLFVSLAQAQGGLSAGTYGLIHDEDTCYDADSWQDYVGMTVRYGVNGLGRVTRAAELEALQGICPEGRADTDPCVTGWLFAHEAPGTAR